MCKPLGLHRSVENQAIMPTAYKNKKSKHILNNLFYICSEEKHI